MALEYGYLPFLRASMEKGSRRPRARPVAGALCLIGFAAAFLVPGRAQQTPPAPDLRGGSSGDRPSWGSPAPSGPWWELGLVVSVKGEYAVRGGAGPVSGTYAFRARWTGRLELDSDGDFLLVHLGTEVLDWRLRETGRVGGRESVLEASGAAKPSLRMEYLIKDGREVEFVFGLGSLLVPLHEPDLGLPLELPRTSSRGPGSPGRGYADFICRGSCRVAVPETDLVETPPERRFSWDWKRERIQVREGRTVTLVESHAAETAVTIVVH
jgi:hypothetical protein